MNVLTQFLTWLSGKKTVISGCVGLIVGYLAVKGIIGDAEVYLISGLNILIFGGASYLTGKLVYGK